MRDLIDIVSESSSERLFYHGSYDPLPVGTIMTGRGQDYENDWQNTDFYSILEKYRPENMISHRDAVFMCDNDDDLDAVGGATDYVLTLVALDKVERHDINWSSAISMALDQNMSDEEIAEFARKYWSGEPSDDPLWEYLTRSAKVQHVEEF